MPIPEDRLYHSAKLNYWFAASSVIMTASILYMIAEDYNRPWRVFQDEYFAGKATFAYLNYLDAVRQEPMDAVEKARQRLTDAEEVAMQTVGQDRLEVEEALAVTSLEFRKADDKWSRRAQPLEVTRDTYERIKAEYGEGHGRTIKAHEGLMADEVEVDLLRIKKEKFEDEKKRLEKKLGNLNAEVRTASQIVKELEQIAIDAQVMDQQYRGVLTDEGLLAGVPIVAAIINAPLFDFAAPKNTPAHHQIHQLVLPDIRQNLNYLDTYTTDRCTTCHIAINDEEFSKDRLARKLERSFPGVNEALQRMGHQPLAFPDPPETADGDQLSIGKVTDHWDELAEEQQDVYFDALLGLINQFLTLAGRPTIELEQPILAHPDLDLFVSVDSPHPMAKIGCTVCHEGNPQETDFVFAAHVPATHKIQKEWEDEYYIHRLGVTAVTFETIAHYWDRPMQLKMNTEAGCAKCHTEITDIARYRGERKGARLNLGRYLFTNVGCVNCHEVDPLKGSRRVGPDLRQVAAKLTPAFVQQWAHKPQAFRPSTRMPHFFLQENNGPASANKFDPDPVLRTETEVAAISKYLFTVSQEWQPIAKPEGVEGDVERGRELFRKTGCVACHANIAEFGEEWITDDLVYRTGLDEETAKHRYKGMTYDQRVRYAMEHFVNDRETFLDPDKARFNPDDEYHTPTLTRFAPELSAIGSKVKFEWLYSWLIEPTHYAPDTKMPSFRLREQEAADITTYLLSLRDDRFEQYEFEMNESRKLMADDLMYTLLSALRSERRSRSIMRDEGGELTNMLVSLLESSKVIGGHQQAYDLISPLSLEEKKLVWLGNKVIAHYGCYACHEIAGFETTTPPGTDLSEWAAKPISQLDFAFYDHAFHDMRHEKREIYDYVYPRAAHELNRLSPLDDEMHEEITHTHGAFAKHKMLNPRIWDREKIKRPYDKLKMPNFYFTEEETDALTTYMLSRVPAGVSDSLKIDYQGGVNGPIAAGRNLTRELNCIGCHEVEDNVPTIQQYFRRTVGGELQFDATNAPPSLRGEGAKVQHPWFHRFLQQVETLRPWLQVRMPSFNLTGDQATTLVEYFAALSRQDSMELQKRLARIDEYIGLPPNADEEKLANWYEQESLETSAMELRRWGLERKLMRPMELDPHKSSPKRLQRGHTKLLKRVRALADLYDVEYPFVEPPQPLLPQARFDHGFDFFNDMGCLGCHVLGSMLPGPAKNTDDFVQMYRLDGVRGEGKEAVAILNDTPYAIGSVIDGHTLLSAANTYNVTGDVETKVVIEGPNKSGETERIALLAPSAPNLSLTHQRLRREWVHQWMVIPAWIQPGTNMPQNFADGVSPYLGDEKYPGDSADHINLLVDFLYDAGTTNARAPLPKSVVADVSDEFDDEGDLDEEEFDD